MNRRQVCLATLFAGVAACAVPVTSFAQTTQLDDIVVTGQRQAYRGDVPIKELPQVVTVIQAETISDLGLTKLSAVLDMTSGVTRQNSFAGQWDAFAIRGFAGDENSGGVILVNGYRSTGTSGPRDASSIERIEVFKGPTSALFGRGDPGGVVNIVTKRPFFEDRGTVKASIGSFATYRGEGDVNMALNDAVAIRLTGAYEQSDGFRDFTASRKIAFAPSLLWKIAPSTSLTLDTEYTDQEHVYDRGVVAIEGRLGVIPITRFLGEPADGPRSLKGFGQQAQLQHDFNADWSVILGATYRRVTNEGRQQEADPGRVNRFSATNPILPRRGTVSESENHNYGYRAELSGNFYTGPMEHHMIAGADWDHGWSDSRSFRYRSPPVTATTTIQQANGINVLNPVYGLTVNITAPNASSKGKTTGYGFYAANQIDVTENLHVRVAGRLDHYHSRNLNRLTGLVSRLKVKEFTPQIGIIYDVNESLSVYASAGKGFRPNGGTNFQGVPHPPEQSEAYEAGLRYITGRFSSNLAVWTMDKTNVLVSDLVNPPFSMAAGSARSRGVEADFAGQITDTLRVWANYSYIDAFFLTGIRELDFGRDIPPGSPLLNVPKHSGSVMFVKEFTVNGSTATIGGGVTYIDSRVGETGTAFRLPGYTVARLNASYDLTDTVNVYAEVNNLFDKEHYVSSYNAIWVMPGAPRNFTVRLTYAF